MDVIVTTNDSHDIRIVRNSAGFKVGVTEVTTDIDVQVSGSVSSSGIDPLSGLSNLLTLYSVAKL